MIVAPIASDEKKRLEELKAYGILDTPPEEAFDRVTRLAARLLGSPIALISLVDERRQWFKSHYGADLSETPREWAFCGHAILEDDVMVVPDATKDDRFRFNPLVVDEPRIRFYAGMPLRSPHGTNLGTLCVIDRTPRLGLSEVQRQILKDLAAIVIDELELRLSARRVLNSYRERQELIERVQTAYRSKSDFLAHISHELRNPLNAILGYADLLLSAPYGPLGDPRYAEYIGAVQASGSHMLALVTDILEYAKLEGGTSTLTLETVDLQDVARETLQILGHVAEEKGVRLDIVSPADAANPVAVEADAVKIRQMLINLVSNAIKFTPAGGQVSIYLDRLPDMARIVVKDTGIGIAPGDMAKVMAPFGQVRSNGSPQDGFGLGLPITKALVERHGGTLEIVSTPNQGTEVQLLLPFRQ